MGGFRTVGHSNRSLSEFLDILTSAQVQTIADVRRFPRSRTNPVFNSDSLADDLSRWRIGYRHFPDLGGRRSNQDCVSEDVNAYWRNRSFRNYADYALSEQYRSTYSELVDLGREVRVAIMCAEAVWWRCHRRIITDYLLLDGFEVLHLMGNGREDQAKRTPGAVRTADARVVYPATGPEDTE